MKALNDGWEAIQAGDDEIIVLTYNRAAGNCSLNSTGAPSIDLLFMQRIFNDWIDEVISE